LAASAGKVLGPTRLGTAGKNSQSSRYASSTPQSQAFFVSADGKCDDYGELVPLGHVPDDGGTPRGLVSSALGIHLLTGRGPPPPRNESQLPAASQDMHADYPWTVQPVEHASKKACCRLARLPSARALNVYCFALHMSSVTAATGCLATAPRQPSAAATKRQRHTRWRDR
jgi:hypothetical protein